MTTHGKYCDFDFYVTSLDAENGCAATEPMSSGLSLLEALRGEETAKMIAGAIVYCGK